MPIKFEIYREGKLVTAFTPVDAIAMGPESVPIPGQVVFQDGLLQLLCDDDHATGVSLLWDAGEVGQYQLETTRLQARPEPYNLNIELARARLMKIVQKQEDWNLFDFPRAEKLVVRFRETQALFADALGHLDNGVEAATMADEALAAAIEVSEELASFHAELLLNRRRQSNQLAKHIFGCRVDSTVQNQKYKETLATQFDYAVLPMSWKQIQPEEGTFHTKAIDEWVDLLTRKRMPVIAGPLIDLTEAAVPDWMFIWEHDFDTLRELVYEHVQKVVQRYRKTVSVWNVVAGLHANTAFSLSFEQVIELTRLLVSQVKTIIPGARTLVTLKQPWGEYHARGTNSVPPMLYAEMVAQSGINFEGFGLEMELGVPASGMFTRDLFQISCMLDKFSTVGRPVFLTAMGVPDRAVADPSDQSEGHLVPAAAGRWHKPWDQFQQARWVEAVYKLVLSKPFVESIAWGNLADMSPTLPGGGLMDDMLKPKPAFVEVQRMREGYQRQQAKK